MLTPVILALTKLRQDDCEIEASLEFMVSFRLGWAAELRSFLKKKKRKGNMPMSAKRIDILFVLILWFNYIKVFAVDETRKVELKLVCIRFVWRGWRHLCG